MIAPSSARRNGLTPRWRARNTVLTNSATRIRASSASSPIKSTHPTRVSLRHISRGSHQAACFVVAVQKTCRSAQWRQSALTDRVAACPQKYGVHQGDSDRPKKKHHQRGVAGVSILVRIAINCQVYLQDAPCDRSRAVVPVIVLDSITEKRTEDASGRARHQYKCGSKGQWQDAIQPALHDGPASTLLVSLITSLGAMLEHTIPPDEPCSKCEQHDDGPQGAHSNPITVAPQAGGGHEDALQIGRPLKKGDPPGEIL
mmetsp:Transcript_87825/g.264116  ORF Transcript_87825/g.264116 Transcript_87825/m.264116 type:complete len:258 (+) Transcript_87825:1087-1860(+)